MSKPKFYLLVLAVWAFATLAVVIFTNDLEDAEAYTVAQSHEFNRVTPVPNGWSVIMMTNDPHDATAVDTISTFVRHANLETMAIWTKADENTGTVDVTATYEFYIPGIGWAFDTAGADVLFTNLTEANARWHGMYVPSSAGFEMPGAHADSMRVILTGNAGNGADIDFYMVLSGGW